MADIPMQLDGGDDFEDEEITGGIGSVHNDAVGPEDQKPSPTEIAESEQGDPDADHEMKVKLEKRKRNENGAAVPVPSDDEDGDESPSKRPLRGDDQPLTSRELRELLFGHVSEMKSAWKEFQGRLGRVEQDQKRTDFEVRNLQSRTRVLEKDSQGCRQLCDSTSKKLDELTEEVKNMKVQLAEPARVPNPPPGPQSDAHGSSDPWSDYLRKRQSQPPESGVNSKGDLPDKNDMLTDDEKRTLVVGGWLQDTKRSVIEEEIAGLLSHEDMKPLLDADRLAIYGPRRSVGMLKFVVREGESYSNVRNRMWEVIKALGRIKYPLPSTKNGDETRTVWASFVKTKSARQRSTHVSMIRRVTIALAVDANANSGVNGGNANTSPLDYDCDWNMGTVWAGSLKLGSATHRMPRDEDCVTMTGGWVSLSSVARTAGCSTDDAKMAFEPHPKDQRASLPSRVRLYAKRRWGRAAQWNLGGQDVTLLDLAAKDANLLFVQEISRDVAGWDDFDTDEFHWVVHRDPRQWRGVAIGFSLDIFDSVLFKIACSRGIWLVARVKGLGRVVLGSLHAHTGTTNAVYQAAIHEFLDACPRRFRHLPLLCGVDANEVPTWIDTADGHLDIGTSSTNLNEMIHGANQLGCKPIPPCLAHRNSPTHFPRDPLRSGRQIDMILNRQINVDSLVIDAERRHVVGSDHAFVYSEIYSQKSSKATWGNDSRARWVHTSLPTCEIVDAEDLELLAEKYTRPVQSKAYRDDDEVKNAILHAREVGTSAEWKKVHKLRRSARKRWKINRFSEILKGDWTQYRQLQNEKKRCRGWWGELLADRSSEQLTHDIKCHLEEKMCDADRVNWNDELHEQVSCIEQKGDFRAFTLVDMRTELQSMKCRSAVGPDKIGVHLLREIANHETLCYGLLDLINHIVRTQELPEKWEVSFLALLAKCKSPAGPKDLRPICISSAFQKLISKMVCARAMPVMRRGSRVSCCGRGRQAADLIGCISRMRDSTKEWKLPMLLCKLDVAGAFDRVDRSRVAQLLVQRLAGQSLDAELRYLLLQLREHHLVGAAPGGHPLSLSPNVGIKQGAVESAEIFGLVVDALLMELVECKQWGDFGLPFENLQIDLLFYQDDIFILETEMARLARRIRVVDRCLQRAGLKLAAEKTKIVANQHYRGCRKVRVGDACFEIAPLGEGLKVLGLTFSLSSNQSEQAQELISRTRAAAAAHREILNAPGSWHHKMSILRSLVESQFAWTAGALHWSKDDLNALNLVQLHTCRSAFKIRRLRDESWVSWHSRSLRFVRVWLVNQHFPRWSERVLVLQHTLHGHWARHVEIINGVAHAGAPLRALNWRNMYWWRAQQALSDRVGVRHEGRFYASNTERQLAQCHGTLWHVTAQDRDRWTRERPAYVQEWDVRWCNGRQLSIRF
ncbi:pol [Symbiodinium sp. CCMP2592]|nr:pol [Symbiodinium sp. CCMP2592]